MANQTKLTFTVTAEGTRRFLEEMAAALEAVAVPGSSTVSGKPVYRVTSKTITLQESDVT